MPALALGLLTFPGVAAGANNDYWTEPRIVALDQNDVRNNTAATEDLDAAQVAPEPLTPAGLGLCNDGEFNSTTNDGIDMTNTVWYRVTGDGRPVTLDLRGSGIDTVVAVYRGGATPSQSSFVTCGDDVRLSETTADPDTELTFQSQAGAAYLVQIGAADCPAPGCSAQRTGTIDFLAWKAPGNDSPTSAATLTSGPPRPFRTSGATTRSSEDPRLDCRGEDYSRTVWFRYVAPGNGQAVFQANGNFDSLLSVYRGGTFVDCNDDGATNVAGPSELTVRVTAGTYLMQVGAIGIAPNAEYGSFGAAVKFTPDPPPPPPPPPDLDKDNDLVNDDIDCDDDNPAINQRATEIRGNAVDEDCVGGPQDYERIAARYRYKTVRGHVVRFKFIRVFDIPAGATLRVTCRGKGCRGKKTYTRRFGKARGRFDLTTRAKRHRLRKGAVLELRVTSPRKIGRVFRIEALADGNSTDSDRCLRPGAKRTVRCRA